MKDYSHEFDILKDWFLHYTEPYFKLEENTNIKLKFEHTMHVCSDIKLIAENLQMKPAALKLAEITALLHDVARFEQFKIYHTFSDHKSFDHAEKAVQIIENYKLLESFEPDDKSVILKAVLYHNRLKLPENEPESVLFFCRLLRDADKLDIYRVVTDYYKVPESQTNSTLELDLPDTPGFSSDVMRQVLSGVDVDYNLISCFNDFKLLQLGWIFSINFTPTLILIKNRDYFPVFKNALPREPGIDLLFAKIDQYIKKRENEFNQ